MPYIGFKKLEGQLSGARNPGAVAASIGREKYGKKAFQKAAAKGVKMKGMKHKDDADSVEEYVEKRNKKKRVQEGY